MDTPQCEHCPEREDDTPEHTFRSYVAWRQERDILVRTVGQDLSLPTLIQVSLESREAWAAMTLFADRIMYEKECRERARQLSEGMRGDFSSPTSSHSLDEIEPRRSTSIDV